MVVVELVYIVDGVLLLVLMCMLILTVVVISEYKFVVANAVVVVVVPRVDLPLFVLLHPLDLHIGSPWSLRYSFGWSSF